MRKSIPLLTKLAAALLQIKDENGHLLIPYDHAKQISASQIVSLFHFDHYPIRNADGGGDEPWNLTPRLIVPHREKTAKVDVPAIAKNKRIRKKMTAFEERMAAKVTGEPTAQKPQSKLRSRGFDRTRSRKFNGTVVRRGN